MAAASPSGSRTSRRAWTVEPSFVSKDHSGELLAASGTQPLTRSVSAKSKGSAKGSSPSARSKANSPTPGSVQADTLQNEEDLLGVVVTPKTSESASMPNTTASQMLVFSVPMSMYPEISDKSQAAVTPAEEDRVQTPAKEVLRLPTPHWSVMQLATLPSTASSIGSDKTSKVALLRGRAIRAVAHLTALLALFVADALFAAEHWDSSDREEASALSIVLLLLYGGLTFWLVASCALPRTWELSGLGIVRLPKTWLVLAVTHTSTAFASSWWREAIRETPGEPGTHAAAVASMLQLLVTVLYPSDTAVSAILAFLSIAALIAVELSVGEATVVIVDNALLLLCAGVTCVVAASGRYWADRNVEMRTRLVNCLIDNIFAPVCDERSNAKQVGRVTTHIYHLTKRLKDAKDRSLESNLDDDVKHVFDKFFGVLLNELTDLNSLDRMSMKDLDELPPMTAEYVQKTLGQGTVEGEMMLETVENIQKTIDANLLTESRNLEALTVAAEAMERSLEDAEDCAGIINSICSMKSSDEGNDAPSRNATDAPMDDGLLFHNRLSHNLEQLQASEGRSADTPASASKPWKGRPPSPPETPAELKPLTFDENIDVMTRSLRKREREESLPHPKLPDKLNEAMQRALGSWHFDIFKLSSLGGGRPLVIVGGVALGQVVNRLQIEASRVRDFLDSLEARYVGNPYHNSMHGADVMNNMLYFLRLQDTALAKLEPIEHLAALTAAAAHDVGHDGFANRFHVTAESPLARLYNDQSPLENMHCTITFSALHSSGSNFLADLEAPLRATFRGYVTQMILETDLAKHIHSLNRFRQELLRGGFDASHHHSFAQRKELATFALKCSDVAHSTKHFDLHVFWTLRINEEFFHQGDTERGFGLPCSPFCDRENINVAESQRGFYDFIVTPLFKAMDEHLSGRLQMEVMRQMERNHQFWKCYDGSGFNYDEPLSNVNMLREHYATLFNTDRPAHLARHCSWNLMPLSQPESVEGEIQKSHSLTSSSKVVRPANNKASSPSIASDGSVRKHHSGDPGRASLQQAVATKVPNLNRPRRGSNPSPMSVQWQKAGDAARALADAPEGGTSDSTQGRRVSFQANSTLQGLITPPDALAPLPPTSRASDVS